MKNMKQLTAEFQITTPMFIGESDQQCADMVRPPSIKGALRFWWRALRWAEIAANQSNQDLALQTLHREEGELFGASAKEGGDEKKTKASSFLIKTKSQGIEQIESYRFLDSPFLKYLYGPGVIDKEKKRKYPKEAKKHFSREEYLSGGFVLSLCCVSTTAEQENQLKRALLAFGLLGGVGARSRKGFGSIAIKSLNVKNISGELQESIYIPKTTEEYQKKIVEILGNKFNSIVEPPITAFSSLTRIQVGKNKEGSSKKILEDYGKKIQRYRSNGTSPASGGTSDKRRIGSETVLIKDLQFWDDHDLVLNYTKRDTPEFAPRRSIFGLPHNYFFSSSKKSVDITTSKKNTFGRRSSPLFAHVHKFEDGYCLVNILLRSVFLPEDISIEFDGKNQVEFVGNWNDISVFLDSMNSEIILSGTVGNP